jgi:DNA ligase-associated metallophosphoesterase
MSRDKAARAEVNDEVILDGRLALFHQQQRWLAIADLHFGFELSQRAAGSLFPLWGMQTIQSRLEELVNEYAPRHLVLLGDLVHDKVGAAALAQLVQQLRTLTEVILIAGNHDRQIGKHAEALPHWRTDGFCFHHGHCQMDATPNEVQVIGHHHPAQVVRDGAGLRLKLPAFVQQDHCWIMPAFSPWAAGTMWSAEDNSRIWLCSPARIISMAPV